MASQATEPTTEICAHPDCGRRVRARGFCVTCYYRKLRRGELTAGTPTRRWRHRLSEIDPSTKRALCTTCGPVAVVARSSGGGRWRCSVDANARAKAYKAAYRQSRKVMLGDRCEICGRTENLCWDHDHRTELFRGTLCGRCNTAIGMLDDDPDVARSAAVYLERSRCPRE